jgi:hypothetical protein
LSGKDVYRQGGKMRVVKFAREVSVLVLLVVSISGCPGGSDDEGTGSPPPTSSAVAQIDTLEGASQIAYPVPPPANITFADKQGVQQTVLAYPGQVQVFFTAGTSLQQATNIITSLGGTIYSQIPVVGHYLVGIPSTTTEADFIADLLKNLSVKIAAPHVVDRSSQIGSSFDQTSDQIRAQQCLSLIGSSFDAISAGENLAILPPYAIPANINGSTIIDDFMPGDLPTDLSHGTKVSLADCVAGGNPYFKVKMSPPSPGNMVAAIQRTIQGSWIAKQNQPIIINISRQGGQDTHTSWYNYVEKIAALLQAQPSQMRAQILITMSLGNLHKDTFGPPLDVSSDFQKLKDNGYRDVLEQNMIFVGANDDADNPYSYRAPGAGCDVMLQPGALTLPDGRIVEGTSYATPRMEAIAEKVFANNPSSFGAHLTSGMKCTCHLGQTPTPENVQKCNFVFVQKFGSGAAGGHIISSPPGIDCGPNCADCHNTCEAYFSGPVTLSVKPTAGTVFKNWLGNCSGSGTASTCQVYNSPPGFNFHNGVIFNFNIDLFGTWNAMGDLGPVYTSAKWEFTATTSTWRVCTRDFDSSINCYIALGGGSNSGPNPDFPPFHFGWNTDHWEFSDGIFGYRK